MPKRSDHRKKYDLEVSAMLGAHERLIRDLLARVLQKEPDPLTVIEGLIEEMRERSIFAQVSEANAVESDQLNQMISEAIDRTLTGARKQILDKLREEHQRKNKPVK
jgi:hypothetical protein